MVKLFGAVSGDTFKYLVGNCLHILQNPLPDRYGFDTIGLRLICSLLALPSFEPLECPPTGRHRVVRRRKKATMYRFLDRKFHVVR
jgi:hypothetical protein